MKKYEPSAFLLWNSEDDDYSVALFQEMANVRWSPDEIFLSLSEDKKQWLKVDVKKREDYITYLILSKSIEQLIGTKLLPVLIDVIGQEFVTRRAMLSGMASRLNYEHTKSASRFIKELNPKALIDKCLEKNTYSEHLQYIISLMNTLFEAVTAWNNLNNTGIGGIDGMSPFEELNVAVWKASVIALLMLEVSQTAANVIFFDEAEDKKLDHIQTMIQLTLKDRSIMTSYLALIAESKKNLVPNSRIEELEGWLILTAKHIFTTLWDEFEFESEESDALRDIIREYGLYNVNKALSKVGIDPVFDTVVMPRAIQQQLRVDKDIIKPVKKSHKLWRGLKI